MARTAKKPALITSARISRSLDADERNKRYLITMAFRVICFLSGCLAPQPWNWVLFTAAGVLPSIAVLLANAQDRRTPPPVDPVPMTETNALALTTGTVVTGEVVHD